MKIGMAFEIGAILHRKMPLIFNSDQPAVHSPEGEIVCRGQNADPAPRIHRKQMTGIAAHDNIRPTGGSQRQVLVVLWIVALPNGFSRLDPIGRYENNVENPLAPLNRTSGGR